MHISFSSSHLGGVYQLLCRDLDFKAVLPPCPLQSQCRFSPLSLPPSFLPSLVLCIVTLKNFRSKEPTDWLFNLMTLAKLASSTGITLYSMVLLYKCQNTKRVLLDFWVFFWGEMLTFSEENYKSMLCLTAVVSKLSFCFQLFFSKH